MRITLIQLHDGYHEMSGRYPLGLGYIMAPLLAAGHEVEVIDFKFTYHSEAEIADKLRRIQADLIGLSGLISSYGYLKQVTRYLKQVHPQVPLVLGGPMHFALEPLILQHNPLDALCLGEGEDTLLEMVQALEHNRDWRDIPGLWLKTGDQTFKTPPRSQTEDLDTILYPAWEHLSPRTYRFDPYSGQERPMSILASRGCPSSCDFCARITLERSIRYRSVGHVLHEIKTLYHDYGVRQFTFVDEYFTANMRWVKQLCEALVAENLPDLIWHASSRVRLFDDDTYDLLYASGCRNLSFGVETANPEILKLYSKRQDPQLTRTIFQKLRKRGIRMNFLLIAGAFDETEATLMETASLLMTHASPARFFYLTPLPGTPIYRRAQAEGKLPDEDAYLERLSFWDNSFTERPTLNLTRYSDREFIQIKERVEQDTWKMHQLRNQVGLFGLHLLYLWQRAAAADELAARASAWRQQLQATLSELHALAARYPGQPIDLPAFRLPDGAPPLPLPPSPPQGADLMALAERLQQRYGLWGEQLWAALLQLPERQFLAILKPQGLTQHFPQLAADLLSMAQVAAYAEGTLSLPLSLAPAQSA
jgi:radical SAM superfamily enzyme YgiQ (UPF0313 family)